jgi:pentatricopeptide repeat protein
MIISPYIRPIIFRTLSKLLSQINYSIKTKSSSTSPESTNQLIKTLNNRGDYERAFELFDTLVKQNNVSIISLLNIIDTCTRSGQIERAHQIEIFINQSNKWKDHLRLQTSLIHMYMKCQMIEQGKIIKINS